MKPLRWDEIEGLDPLIAPYVQTLLEAGIETCESCQATEGHLGGLPTPMPGFASWSALVPV